MKLSAPFPNNSDPCEFLLAQGDEAFAELVENGQDYLSFKFARISERYDVNTPFGLNKSVADCVELIRASKTPAMRMHLVQACAKFLNKPERVLEEQAFPKSRKYKTQEKTDFFAEDTKKLGNVSEVEKLADTLISLCMTMPEKINEIRENFGNLNFSAEIREILESFFAAFDEGRENQQFFSTLSPKAKQRLSGVEEKFGHIFFGDESSSNNDGEFETTWNNCLLIKKNIELNTMLRRIKNRLKSDMDAEEKKVLLDKLVRIQQELKKIDKHLQI